MYIMYETRHQTLIFAQKLQKRGLYVAIQSR
nr:MAG TPA: hypothetical protein [Bacteriophage sp.]